MPVWRKNRSLAACTPYSALPEVHGVEVLLEDLLLRVPLGELQRQHDLADLALDVALGREQPVLHELLGDRRPALLDLARLEVLAAARMSPFTSMPALSQNDSSSTATTASCSSFGTWSSDTY